MYGVPEHVDWTFLKGAVLEQICFGKHNIQLRFDRGISISVESQLRLDGSEPAQDGFGKLVDELHMLIGAKIVEAERTSQQALWITIGDRKLEIVDDSDQFESFTVNGDSLQIVV